MKERLKNFLKSNVLTFAYVVFAVVVELCSIYCVGCRPFLTKPLYSLILLGLVISLLILVHNIIAKTVVSSVLLLGQMILNVAFIYLYDSNGTYFEWAMTNQRNDARAIIETLNLRWDLVAVFIAMFVVFLTGGILLCVFTKKKQAKAKTELPIMENTLKTKNSGYRLHISTKIVMSVVLAVTFGFSILNPAINAKNASKMSYAERYLYSDATNKYQQLGITSNALYELVNGTLIDGLIEYDTKGIEDFIYNVEEPYLQTTEYNGISKGNNLVYILVESFEWYVFLNECSPEQSAVLYPNLNRFLNTSVYATEFYSREKTDTAEMLAILGSNPTGKYINYDFPTNEYTWSLPNMFRQSVEDNGNVVKHIKSFHQNTGDFYNRNTLHESLGFEELIDIEDMKKYGIDNAWDEEAFEGERTLDSVTIEKLQDEMFPATADNEQYMTFWLSFVMHGYYGEREGFKQAGYYDLLDSVGAYPKGNGTMSDYLRTYAAAVMDFDRALGIIFDKLEANGDLGNTTIVMFSDHNTYYNNLSYYAKDIDERYNSELYRVPVMIYDEALVSAYEANEGTREISKFTTTSDLIPTVFDMFGIDGYKNLYYGTSMFVDDVESVIFSRAYGIFITNKLICYGANDLIYKSKDYTKADFESFCDRAETLLKKQEILDKIYRNNYFKKHPLKAIN